MFTSRLKMRVDDKKDPPASSVYPELRNVSNHDIIKTMKSTHKVMETHSEINGKDVKIAETHSKNGAQDGETTNLKTINHNVQVTNTKQAQAAITTHINSGNDNKELRVPEMHLENRAPDIKITTKDPEDIGEGVKIKGSEDVKATVDKGAVKPANANSENDTEGVQFTKAHLGHAVQVVAVTETHSYELDEHALQQILMKEEVKDLPVVVVSIAGATRTGKSYLLNFFLKYLTAPQSVRQDGSWLGEESAPLVGFKWRSGSKSTTLGILLWSEPFILTRPSGEKVAVLLIDTQGTFDSTSTVNDCSTIFALSTLLSSVQIYNLSQNIQEDNLQFLQLFTDFGRMVKDQDSKAFQVLEFLVRDWQFPWEHPYGAVGGEQLLEQSFKIMPSQSKDMQEMRKHIRSSFEKVSCFLMPHPGFKILNDPEHKGNISDISIEFRTYVKELVTSLFSSEKLMPKSINGEKVKARDLFNYFKTYMNIFKSNEIPTLTSIHGAMENANLLSMLNEAVEIYENGMDSECGPHQLSISADYAHFLHENYSALARRTFMSKKKMGSKDKADKYLEKLMTELENRLPQFVQGNLAKTQILINKANESYEKAVHNFGTIETLCVHPLDLDKIHKAGLDAALKTFDEGRKKMFNRNDNERAEFIKSLLVSRSTLLEQPNKRNNVLAVSKVHLQYKERMMSKISATVFQSKKEFASEHADAKRQVIEQFKTLRSKPSEYTEDDFMDKLNKMINDSFTYYTELNNNKNESAIDAAVDAFNTFMEASKFHWGINCWSLDHLDERLKEGVYHAFSKIYPYESRAYYDTVISDYASRSGFQQDLLDTLNRHKKQIVKWNEEGNVNVIYYCFEVYKRTMDNSYTWWSFTSKETYHQRAKDAAIREFFDARTDSYLEERFAESDPIYNEIVYRCDMYFFKKYR